MELNKIYNQDCVEGMQLLIPDESVDLIIADPPYFKVVNEKWDYLWRTESDYLEWSKKWIFEASRSLRKGGSFWSQGGEGGLEALPRWGVRYLPGKGCCRGH